MRLKCPSCKQETVPLWRVLFASGTGRFECPRCSAISYPAARQGSWLRGMVIFAVFFGLPVMVLFGQFDLIKAALGLLLGTVVYFLLVIWEFNRRSG